MPQPLYLTDLGPWDFFCSRNRKDPLKDGEVFTRVEKAPMGDYFEGDKMDNDG